MTTIRARSFRSESGFTLIELMVTLAIVGILAAIAWPSYTSYVVKAHRTAAKTALMDLASQQESFFADRKRYATTLSALGLAGNTVYALKDGALAASNSTEAVYQVAIASGATASHYRLTATPIHSQTRDSRCGTLSLDSGGARTASGSDGVQCWRK